MVAHDYINKRLTNNNEIASKNQNNRNGTMYLEKIKTHN